MGPYGFLKRWEGKTSGAQKTIKMKETFSAQYDYVVARSAVLQRASSATVRMRLVNASLQRRTFVYAVLMVHGLRNNAAPTGTGLVYGARYNQANRTTMVAETNITDDILHLLDSALQVDFRFEGEEIGQA